jgi:hypothetical protein
VVRSFGDTSARIEGLGGGGGPTIRSCTPPATSRRWRRLGHRRSTGCGVAARDEGGGAAVVGGSRIITVRRKKKLQALVTR